MNDTVYRKDAIDAAAKLLAERCGGNTVWWKPVVEAVISALPSAQPEIIRCKDCEYYHPYYCEIWSKFGTIQTRENGYCYMAERRTDETN